MLYGNNANTDSHIAGYINHYISNFYYSYNITALQVPTDCTTIIQEDKIILNDVKWDAESTLIPTYCV